MIISKTTNLSATAHKFRHLYPLQVIRTSQRPPHPTAFQVKRVLLSRKNQSKKMVTRPRPHHPHQVWPLLYPSKAFIICITTVKAFVELDWTFIAHCTWFDFVQVKYSSTIQERYKLHSQLFFLSTNPNEMCLLFGIREYVTYRALPCLRPPLTAKLCLFCGLKCYLGLKCWYYIEI